MAVASMGFLRGSGGKDTSSMMNQTALIIDLLWVLLIMQIFIGSVLLWQIDTVRAKVERTDRRIKNYFGGAE
jgi:hypothetical protein